MLKINISKKDLDNITNFLKTVSVPASIGSDLMKIATVLEKAEEVSEKPVEKEETVGKTKKK